MKSRIFALVASLLIASSLSAAEILEIAEVDDQIVATLNGTTPVPVDITGPVNAWTIELPPGFEIASRLLATQISVGEPEDPDLMNLISITQPSFMIWESDIPNTTGLVLPISRTILLAGTLPNGQLFDLVLADRITTVPTPDGGSTIALSGLALVALAALRPNVR